jgi:hypothetical protein
MATHRKVAGRSEGKTLRPVDRASTAPSKTTAEHSGNAALASLIIPLSIELDPMRRGGRRRGRNVDVAAETASGTPAPVPPLWSVSALRPIWRRSWALRRIRLVARGRQAPPAGDAAALAIWPPGPARRGSRSIRRLAPHPLPAVGRCPGAAAGARGWRLLPVPLTAGRRRRLWSSRIWRRRIGISGVLGGCGERKRRYEHGDE